MSGTPGEGGTQDTAPEGAQAGAAGSGSGQVTGNVAEIPAEFMPLVDRKIDAAVADLTAKVRAQLLQEQEQARREAEMTDLQKAQIRAAELERKLEQVTGQATFESRVNDLMKRAGGRIPISSIREAVRDHQGDWNPDAVFVAAQTEVHSWAKLNGLNLDAPPPPPDIPGPGGSPAGTAGNLTDQQILDAVREGRMTSAEANAMWNQRRFAGMGPR